MRTLRWFQMVCDGTTLTELSAIEHVSQPAVSRALLRLEEEVGAPLLRKYGRVLRMTAAGAAFKREVDEIIHRLDDGLAAVSQAADPETGLVRLAFQPALGSWLIPELIRSFRAVHPAVSFALEEVRGDAAAGALESGEADLVIGVRRLHPHRMHRLPLLHQQLAVAVGTQHPLAQNRVIALASMAEETFVLPQASSSLGARVRALCTSAGFEPAVGFESEDLTTLRGFVAAGLGVSILPRTRMHDDDAPVRHIPLDGAPLTQEIALSWASSHPLLPSPELFRDHVARLRAGGQIPTA